MELTQHRNDTKSVLTDGLEHNPILSMAYGHTVITRNTTFTTVVFKRHLRQTADPTVFKFCIFNAIFLNWLAAITIIIIIIIDIVVIIARRFVRSSGPALSLCGFTAREKPTHRLCFPHHRLPDPMTRTDDLPPGNARKRQSFCTRNAPRGRFMVIIVRTTVRRLLRSPGMECVECNENKSRAYYGTGNSERWLLGRIHLSSRERRRISK